MGVLDGSVLHAIQEAVPTTGLISAISPKQPAKRSGSVTAESCRLHIG